MSEGSTFSPEANKACIACQKCCVDVLVPTSYENDDEEAKRFYSVRGFKVSDGEDGYLNFEIAFPCPQLTASGCSIYETRPETCREFVGIECYRTDCGLYHVKRAKVAAALVSELERHLSGKVNLAAIDLAVVADSIVDRAVEAEIHILSLVD